ncbi:K+/H+ antiporter subunit F [Tranquillimonas alkanivorans]|uniref:Multisubunit potassium/proton antiporter, PhaF subunit n=1 Tax=Tranquillimonas alkanivorans TaxID=441119 RepID=A0A1I5Q858_9RHOB|nr:K+/H+ antiporter subunit F [Tranquillimonas alkanivorans]SFP42409.1 multisubunit potassium/proton antiporter, PhaF subunit [Tranquillimonas alkanivorans]
MIFYALLFAYVCIALSLLLALWRLIKGPNTIDRVLALDTMIINGIGLIVIYGVSTGSKTYFESALIIAMLGFVSTVAYARFILRGNIIE